MGKEEKYRELLQLQKESNLNVKDFCYNHGIAHSTFYYWLKKIKRKDSGSNSRDFIPLTIKERTETLPSSIGLNHGQHRPFEELSASFELAYPNGVVLRIKSELDLASLQTLIQLQG